ncbi:MAG: SDR family oxidoreductase [Sediminibacterium sp.]|nr:SDR family oxidoreductase [Sediminibacterium sp.]
MVFQTVESFYANKIITITGVTGFYGKVLFERVLWDYPSIKKINLFIRKNRHTNGFDRFKTDVLHSPIFERVNKRCAEQNLDFNSWIFNKTNIIEVDFDLKDLGLEEQVLEDLFSHTDIFFHIAASVNWDDPIDYTIKSNVINAINLAKLLSQYQPTEKPHFVFISSALIFNKVNGVCPELPLSDLANEDQNFNDIIENLSKINLDEFYKELVLKRTQLMEWATKNIKYPCPYECIVFPNEELKQQLLSKLRRDRTNEALKDYGYKVVKKYHFSDTYTFGKVLTEISLDKFKNELNISIIRPSAISAAIIEPTPGWVERMIAFNPLILKLGSGKLNILPAAKKAILDFIPIDYTINQTLISPYLHQQNNVVQVLHAITSKKVKLKVSHFSDLVLNHFSLMYFKDYKNQNKVARVYFTIPCSLALFGLKLFLLMTLGVIQFFYWVRNVPFIHIFLKKLVFIRRILQKNIRLLSLYRVYLEKGKWIINYEKTNNYLEQLSNEDRKKYNYNIETYPSWDDYWKNIHFEGMFKFILKK